MELRRVPRNAVAAIKSVPNRISDPGIGLLYEMANGVFVAASLQEVLTKILNFVTSVMSCDSCFVYVLEQNNLVLRGSRNPHPEAVDRLKLKIGEGITGWVAEHREPVVIWQNASEDPRFRLFNELPEDRFESFLSVPILGRGQVVGVINLQTRAPYRFADYEIKLISSIGLLVGAELEIARLESENVELSDRLEMRKMVERAKGILQRELRITEGDAYRVMQRESQQRRKSMKDISEAIILNEEMKRKFQ